MKILRRSEVPDEEIFARNEPFSDVREAVAEILKNVKERGDEALRDYTLRFDGADVPRAEVSAEEIAEAVSAVDPAFLAVMREAAEHIRVFHEKQKRSGYRFSPRPGVILEQRVVPLDRVGVYVPGGTAAYPSTVLMDIIPAKIAGCPEVVMVTPPGKDGRIRPVILAAAQIAGADRIFRCGGAQAVAALAYGTETVPRADKIVGPGNAFVAEAKRQVFGTVDIDMVAGPSEILIVADGKTDPVHAAADLLSQAEHDRNASAVLVTDSPELAQRTAAEAERQLAALPREAIARASWEKNGKIIVTESLEEAADVADRIAPEHLELLTDRAEELAGRIRHAGSVFLGRSCPEAVGDYFAGSNHTLPTGGTARFASPLSADDFVRTMQLARYSEEALAAEAEKIALFARKEGLEGHARSVLVRQKEKV